MSLAAPRFWQAGREPGPLLRLALGPFARIYAAATARRVAHAGWTAPVPVICCGNAGAGGSGKTPLAIDLARRLAARGRRPALLTRGHGGSRRAAGPVDPRRDAADAVGDEALLLAEVAPTWRGADRVETARMAIAAGADVLVMDDGLQNPGLVKTASLLTIDGGYGFGNGATIPLGPLREPVAAAASRCRAAVIIGQDVARAAAALPAGTKILRASLAPNEGDLARLPPRLLAFAGIGRPEKFFATLAEAGHAPLESRAFADHRPYTEADLAALRARAAALGAGLVTTAKDLARLPPAWRAGIEVLRVDLRWQDGADIDAILDEILACP
jgi:tetraacyldisaccharide 4'-kinase